VSRHQTLYLLVHFLTSTNSLQTTEVFLYVFDAALMFLVSVVLAIDYPDGEVMGFEEVKLESEGLVELRNLIPDDVHSMQGWEGPSPAGHGKQILGK
jgi:hypothetical protein